MAVSDTNTIDLLARNASTGEVSLIMREPREWSGGDAQIFELQEKLNAYLSFALDGEMAAAFPQCVGAPLRLVIECLSQPDGRTLAFLDTVRNQISFQKIALEVRVVESLDDPPHQCGCGGGGGKCHSGDETRAGECDAKSA